MGGNFSLSPKIQEVKMCQYFKCNKPITDRLDFSSETGTGPKFSTFLCLEHSKEVKRVMSGKKQKRKKK